MENYNFMFQKQPTASTSRKRCISEIIKTYKRCIRERFAASNLIRTSLNRIRNLKSVFHSQARWVLFNLHRYLAPVRIQRTWGTTVLSRFIPLRKYRAHCNCLHLIFDWVKLVTKGVTLLRHWYVTCFNIIISKIIGSYK